jgi:hypothetical protein
MTSFCLIALLLTVGCSSTQIDENHLYTKLETAKVDKPSNSDIQAAKNKSVTSFSDLINKKIKKNSIVKVAGETSTLNTDENSDDWGIVKKGYQYKISDSDFNDIIIKNQDSQFKGDIISKSKEIVGVFVGTAKEKLSKEDKEDGLTAKTVPLIIGYSTFSHSKTVSEKKKEEAADKEYEKLLADSNKQSLNKKIKSAAKPQIGKVEEVEINDDAGKNDGGKIVLIHIKSNEATKRVALYQTSLIMSKEFKIKKVNEVVVFWDADVVDKYGKESVGALAKVGLTKNVAKKIQWNSFDYTQYPNVTDNYYMSKLLK